MTFSATVAENNSSPTTTSVGQLPLGGGTVTGVAFAGTHSGGVGAALTGVFGTLTVNADGTFAYVLNNLDPDTQLLSTGDMAHDRFVVTYTASGQVHTLDLDFVVAGADEPGQATKVRNGALAYSANAVLPLGTYLNFTSSTGVQESFSASYKITVENDGAISLRSDGAYYRYGVLLTGYGNTFNNKGRVSASAVDQGEVYAAITDAGTNDGVLQATQTYSNPGSASFTARAIGWEVGSGTNNGLIDVTSSREAFGVWAPTGGDFVNNGIIRVQGGQSDDPLGVIGYRSGQATGHHFTNTGTIAVISTNPATTTVGVQIRPDNTNLLQTLTIDNSGTIVAAIAIEVANGLEISTHLTNSGHVDGSIIFDSGVNTLDNQVDGSIVGAVTLGPDTDFLSNAGSITGDVALGDDQDIYLGVGAGQVQGTVHGGAGRDLLIGGSRADVLSGDDGDDWIAGGGGADTLTGGAGSDTFAYLAISDSIAGASDTITDFTTGSDHIDISALNATSFTLTPSGNQTILTVVNAVGTLTVTVVGQVAASDIINVPATNPLVGTSGSDVLVATIPGSTIQGGAGADVLLGTAGNDVLDGGTGADTMIGGAGDDVYYVDSLGDRVVESPGGGLDEIRTSISYSLPGEVENATLIGNQPIGLLANNLANVIIGNDAGDYISAQGGDDTIIPGVGTDFILTGSGADRIVYRTATGPGGTRDILGDFQHGVDLVDLTDIVPLSFTFTETVNSYYVFDGPQMPYPMELFNWTDVVIQTTAGRMELRLNGHVDLSDFTWNTQTGQTIVGTSGADSLSGTAAADQLNGLGGNDRLFGGRGNDTIDGGAGIDLAIYTATRAQSAVTPNANGTLTVSSSLDGTDTVTNVELFQFADGLFSFRYADPGNTVVSNFAVNAGGWSSQDKYPRHVADVNGDGFADIVGFGQAGTLVAYGSASGTFSAPVTAVANFGQAQGWSSDNTFHRELIDVNHDGKADIVGFGTAGVLVSLAQANGSFAAPLLASTNFNPANGWSSEDGFTRTLADVNGDGFADVVGFGTAGTLVALGKGDGTFGTATFALANFGANQGWTSDNTFHRTVADVNGDGRADIVGFGTAGTLVALGQADGTFAPATLAQANFGTSQGWSSQDAFARVVGDVNGDGMADVVGFGVAGTFVSYGQADGTFSAAGFDVANFGANQGWTSDNILHRELADLNKDGRADIVGFGSAGVFVSAAFAG